MAQVKTVKTRIQHKHDIEANWIKATNFVPLAGELIIYDAETTSTSLEGTGRTEPISYVRFKFGNGTDKVTDLAFSASPVDWDQNDPQASDYIKNRTHYVDSQGNVVQLDAKYIPIDNDTITTDAAGKLKANIPSDVNTTYTLSKVDNEIILTDSDGNFTKVTDDKGSDGLIYKETTTTETINVTTPTSNLDIPVLCYGDGRLILQDNYYSVSYYSDDNGQSWQTANSLTIACEKLAFGNSVFVGIDGATSNNVQYSTDGTNWQGINLNDVVDSRWYFSDIAFGDGKFIAVSDMGAMWSTDGINWSAFEASGWYVAIGNNRVVITDTTGGYSVYSLDGNFVSSASIPGMDPIDGIKFINNQFVCYGNIIATSSNGENWQTFALPTDATINDILYFNENYILYIDDSLIYTTTTIGEQWSSAGFYNELNELRIANTGNLLVACGAQSGMVCSSDGINWGTSANIINSTAYLEQAGTDVTSKVAKLVGGNGGGGNVDGENATLENLTITGALTLEGDLAFGDLDVTTVTAEKITVENDPVDDNDVATKKYVDEHSGGSTGGVDEAQVRAIVEDVLLNGNW